MNFSFDPEVGLVIIQSQLVGPSGTVTLNLALDTGASRTLLNEDLLISVGYDLANAVGHSKMTTGSKVEPVALICIDKLIALGQERNDRCLSHLAAQCERGWVAGAGLPARSELEP